MVDISTHQILDMISSREYEAVCEWLKTYPNLHVVSRDGSATYNNAIADAHPVALQISDRFHLLKNLTSYGTEYLKKELKPQILIQAVGQEASNEGTGTIKQADENRKLTLKEKYEKIQKLLSAGKCKTAICRSINTDVRAYDKLMTMTPEERNSSFQTKLMTEHEEDENFNPVHASYDKKKNGKLTPYIKEIDKCFEKGIMGSTIEKKIRGMG